MRPGQNYSKHNNRPRGRSNNNNNNNSNRRHTGGSGGGGGNPINRVYESNGPDVKVRGTAQTVAEKYLQLGRDAQLSGDTVMAESYYQHAEHYFRILSAAQAYLQQHQPAARSGGDSEESDEGNEGDGDGDDVPMTLPGERAQYASHSGPVSHSAPASYSPPAGEGEQPDLSSAPSEGTSRPPQEARFGSDGRPQGRFRNRFDRNREPREPRFSEAQGTGTAQPHVSPEGSNAAAPAHGSQPVAVDVPDNAPQPVIHETVAPAEKAVWSEDSAPSFLRRPRAERKPRRTAAEMAAAAAEAATASEKSDPE